MIGAEALHKSGDARQRMMERIVPWRIAWDHALTRYYRARPRWRLSSGLARWGVGLVWGLFLVGTALGVAFYPTATDVTCDWFSCNYPMLGTAIYGLLSGLTSVFFTVVLIVGCGGPVVLLGLVIVSALVPAVARWLRRGPQGPQIATAWQNGAIELLTITPLGAPGLLRVRFLTRLYGLWQHRALFAMLFGVVACYFVSLHVLYPIFWWLGPWRQWAVQLGLVLLWGVALATWIVTVAAHGVLREVTYSPRPGGLGASWSSVSMLTLLGMFVTPIVLGILNSRLWSGLNYHDTNAMSVVSAPLILILVGALYIVINYQVAGWVFRLRLRTYSL